MGDASKFETLWRDKDQLLEEYFALAKAQSAAFDEELAACTLIQRVWRGVSARLRMFERSFAVLTIQRIARGFSGRLEYAQRLIVAQRKSRMKFYDDMATRIEKRWRGVHSRKVKHDYYARKLFLRAIEQKNEEHAASVERGIQRVQAYLEQKDDENKAAMQTGMQRVEAFIKQKEQEHKASIGSDIVGHGAD